MRLLRQPASSIPAILLHSRYADRRRDPGICDLTFGNPHEMPLPGLVDAIRHRAVPLNKDWFAYKTSEPEPQAFLAERLTRELSLPFEPADIALTTGAMAAIAVAFHLLLDAEEEAIFSTPSWFFYEPMLRAADAVPKKVRLQGERFDLDLSAIEQAISPRTRLVIINTPHNPTGRIYSRDQLVALADLLNRASERIGRRIFILSDEPYRRIRFDGHDFVSPAAVYPVDGDCLQLRQGSAGSGAAAWLPGPVAADAERGQAGPPGQPIPRPDVAGVVLSQCGHAVCPA